MAKRTKIYDSETGEVMEAGSVENKPKPSQELLDGFYDTFTPCSSERMADEVFTMGKLREYFQCYISVDPRWGDMLPEYIAALVSKGYKVRTSYSGEPAIFVLWNGCPLASDVEEEEEEY